MDRYYSKATGTTYLAGVHLDIPDDAVKISEDRYDEVIRNPDPLKIRAHDEQGLPILVDGPPLSAAEAAAVERGWRDSQLSATQWLVARYSEEQSLSLPTTNTTEQLASLLGYRQALRDWPQSEAFPATEHRPVAPSWIADQL